MHDRVCVCVVGWPCPGGGLVALSRGVVVLSRGGGGPVHMVTERGGG